MRYVLLQNASSQVIRMGHGPDADDAFISYAIKHGHVGWDGARFLHRTESMEQLNRLTMAGELDLTAISAACYPHVADRYWIMSYGGSMTTAGGPLLVAAAPTPLDRLAGKRIAVAGTHTTGHLLLRLALQDWECVPQPYDAIADAVVAGDVDAGLMIHEGQITYQRWGLHRVLDLGDWWRAETRLPLPLALNVVAKSVGREDAEVLVAMLRDSAAWAFKHPEPALAYAQKYADGLSEEDTYVLASTFLNEHSLGMSGAGRAGLRELFDRAAAADLCPAVSELQVL